MTVSLSFYSREINVRVYVRWLTIRETDLPVDGVAHAVHCVDPSIQLEFLDLRTCNIEKRRDNSLFSVGKIPTSFFLYFYVLGKVSFVL